jgi:hypothetical protein
MSVLEHFGTDVNQPSARTPPPVTCIAARAREAWMDSITARTDGSIVRRRLVRMNECMHEWIFQFMMMIFTLH